MLIWKSCHPLSVFHFYPKHQFGKVAICCLFFTHILNVNMEKLPSTVSFSLLPQTSIWKSCHLLSFFFTYILKDNMEKLPSAVSFSFMLSTSIRKSYHMLQVFHLFPKHIFGKVATCCQFSTHTLNVNL